MSAHACHRPLRPALLAAIASLIALAPARPTAAASAPSFDWAVFARQHDAAMRAYHLAQARHADTADATCHALLAAGAERAIDAPLQASSRPITPARAAEMLDHFGALATPTCAPWPMPERALRRALALDPERHVAHLDLADALRTDLQQVVRGDEDVDTRRAEIRREYLAFLDSGGERTPEMDRWTSPPLDLPARTDTCSALQAYLRAGRLVELQSAGGVHLEVAKHHVDVTVRRQGSGLAPAVYLNRVPRGDVTFEGEVFAIGTPRGEASLVTIAGRHHVLLMNGGSGTGETVPLDGGAACVIERRRTESVAPESAEPAFCRRVLSGPRPREIEFPDPSDITEDALARRWTGDLEHLQAQGSALVDLANDGHPVRLLHMTATIEQPGACTVQLHDLVDDEGIRLLDAGERQALATRGIEADDPTRRPGADCYGEKHYLRDGARTVVEAIGHEPDDESNIFSRRISINEQGQWRDLCTFKYDERWTVRPGQPAD